MGAGSFIRKQFAGGAPATTITSTITDAATTFDLDDASGWPDATNPFVAVIDRGLATEEKILVGGRTTVTLSSITRGYDDTTAAAHTSGASIEHVIDASTIDQVNRAINLLLNKGEILSFNGTNVTAVTATAQADDSEDQYALVVNNANSTGLAFERPIHLVDSASTPAITGVPRIWYDQNTETIRTSDGTSWKTPAGAIAFADDTAKDAYFGATPTTDGVFCFTGTGATLVLQVWDGTTWITFPTIYEGLPRFADDTARDAFFTSPSTGDHAYLTGTHQLTEYREDEWILINRKFTTSATAPTSPHDGDIWIQPV